MIQPGTSSSTKLLFAITLAALFFGSLFQHYFGSARDLKDEDFDVYYFAAQIVHEHPHGDLYQGATEGNPQLRDAPQGSEIALKANAAGFDAVEMYLYPPMLADLLAPVSSFPLPVAVKLWRLLNLGLVLVTVLAIARMLGLKIMSAEFVLLMVAAYSFFPVFEAIPLGQITIVMMALWAVGIAAFAEGKVVLSAVALALATSLKVTPLMLVPLFLLWKDRRWLVAYSIALLGMIGAMGAINGWGNMLAYRQVVAGMGNSVPTILNRCISSLIAWIYYGRFIPMPKTGETFADPPKALALLGKICSMGFYGFSLFLAWRQRKVSDYRSRAATVAIFAFVSVLVAPVTWRHGYTMAFVPLAVLWVQALRTPGRRIHTVLLTLTSICIGTVFLDLGAQSGLPFVIRIFCAGAWTVLSAALCIDALRAEWGAVGETDLLGKAERRGTET